MTERTTTGFVRTLLSFRHQGVSGALRVKAEGVSTLIHLRKGQIISAEGGTVGETLGRLLVDERVLSPDQYAEAIRVMTDRIVDDEQMRLGEVLVQLGFMSVDDVQAALLEQVHRKVMGCMRWETMNLQLRTSSGTQLGHFLTPIEPTVLAGVQRFVSIERQRTLLAPVDDRLVSLRGSEASVKQRYKLPPAQLGVLRILDGTHTGAELRAQMTDRDALSLITTMMMIGDLAVREPERAHDVAPAAAKGVDVPPRRQKDMPRRGSVTGRPRPTRPARPDPSRRVKVPEGVRARTQSAPESTPSPESSRPRGDAGPVRKRRGTASTSRPQDVRTRRVSPDERDKRRQRTTGQTTHPEIAPGPAPPAAREAGESLFRRRQKKTDPRAPGGRVGGVPADELRRRGHVTHSALDVEEGRRLRSTSSNHLIVPKRGLLEAERAYHFGLKHLYATRFAQALPQFELAARRAPDVFEYLLAHRFCRFRQTDDNDGVLDERDKLVQLAEQTRTRDPTLALPPYVMGHLLMMVGQHREALDEFKIAASRAPDNRDAERCIRVLEKRLKRGR